MSSTIPSTKYSCSGSPLMFWNGRIAIDGVSGCCRRPNAPLPPRRTRKTRIDWMMFFNGGVPRSSTSVSSSSPGRVLSYPRRDEMPPGSASSSSRAAPITPSPSRQSRRRPRPGGPRCAAEGRPPATAGLLDRDGAAQCLNRARERGEEPVAGGLEQPATVSSQLRLDHFAAERPHARESTRLVGTDHRRVADHVGGQDSSEAAVYVTDTHSTEPCSDG